MDLTPLTKINWGAVLRTALAVSEAAAKLSNIIRKKSPSTDLPANVQANLSPEAIASLHARLELTAAAVSELHGEMLASSDLIKALADQNALLVKGIALTRIKMIWLTAATTILGIASTISLVLLLAR